MHLKRPNLEEVRYVLERIVEASAEAIILVDENQKITMFNKGAERIFRWTAAEIVGMPLDILLPHSVRDRHRRHLNAFQADGDTTRYMQSRQEIRGLRSDGEEFPAEATITKIVVDGGTHFAVILRDITNRRLREQALEESEQRFRALFQQTHQFVLLLGPDGTILEANTSALAFIEAEIGDIRGQRLPDLPWLEELPESSKCLETAIQDGARKNLVEDYVALRARDGQVRTFAFSLKPIVVHEGMVSSLLFEARDVSALIETNAALREREQLLRNAQKIGRMGNWAWSLKTNHLHWSDEIYRIFGISPQEFGASYDAFLNTVHPEDRAMVEDNVQAALEGRQPYALDHRIVRPDGEIRVVHEQAEITFDDAGRPASMEGIVQDVTETRAIEAELQEAREAAEAASAAKSRFLATVSHELKTPLNAIIGFSQVLAQELFGPLGHSKYQQYVDDVLASAHHLKQIIENILYVTRLDDHSLVLAEDVVAVADLLSEAAAAFDDTGAAAADTIHVAETRGEVSLRADPRLVHQMLINLIGNSLKFSPADSTVDIAAFTESGCLKIAVTDQGEGIPADKLERTSDPFFQVDDDINRRFEGIGLGLFLVDQFIRLHGGDLHIASTPDAGTTAVLSFPADRVVHQERQE